MLTIGINHTDDLYVQPVSTTGGFHFGYGGESRGHLAPRLLFYYELS